MPAANTPTPPGLLEKLSALREAESDGPTLLAAEPIMFSLGGPAGVDPLLIAGLFSARERHTWADLAERRFAGERHMPERYRSKVKEGAESQEAFDEMVRREWSRAGARVDSILHDVGRQILSRPA